MKTLNKVRTITARTCRGALPILKASAPVLLCGAVTASHCFAGTSPLAKLLTDVASEATGTWAVAGAGIGLTVGIVGLKMEGGQNHKGPLFTLTGLSFLLLSVNALVSYLQGE